MIHLENDELRDGQRVTIKHKLVKSASTEELAEKVNSLYEEGFQMASDIKIVPTGKGEDGEMKYDFFAFMVQIRPVTDEAEREPTVQ